MDLITLFDATTKLPHQKIFVIQTFAFSPAAVEFSIQQIFLIPIMFVLYITKVLRWL